MNNATAWIYRLLVMTVLIGVTQAYGPTLSAQEDVKFPKVNDSNVTPVAIAESVQISPANTSIHFIGTHVGDEPKPRLGGFSKFGGTLEVDPMRKVPTSLMLEVEMGSVWTQFDKLTAHLKNPDFFEVSKYPKAQFKSSEITIGSDGKCKIAGQFTLHGTTGPLSFPATVRMDDSGMLLMAEFQLDRAQFGMDKMLEGVEKLVSIQLVVGKPTEQR